ncbi:uncharacterized protein TNCV_2484501 [Trichonephila clavipes]|uniref:Mutator-like transposase domain-containing protein n=1 Tax=Trichonephila clavipes TaxID=2585209 RepID=A0A8X6VZH8_TRICX|nr:uncharacterized protein TNCV_2484501 [Trichonephila clavipes]
MVSFLDVTGMKPCPDLSPNQNALRIASGTEPTLIPSAKGRVPELYCKEARHTSLRNKVKEWKVKKVTLGGRKQGSLTDKNITKLQNYYRKAIKDNVPDTDKMKTAIYASLMHCSSTDKNPMDGKCPEGESSWCFYKRAIAKGETPGSHSSMRTYLSPQVVEKIMPFQRFQTPFLKDA